MPEKSVLILVFHLGVGNRRLAYRTPVDDPGALVDISFFIQLDEHFLNGSGASLVHSEAFSLPVRGRAKLLQLIDDLSAVLLFPRPRVLQEFLTADLILVDAFFFQFLNYLNLCGDGRMVGSRLPESLVSFHSFEADQDILHGLVKGMAHMKLPGNIGRRHYYCKRFFFGVYFCVEVAVVHPFFVQAFFQAFRIIGLCQFSAHLLLLKKQAPHTVV